MHIVDEDTQIIVISKPAGLLSQAGPAGESTNVVSLLQEYLARHYVGLIHRLDRNSSGLMILAKRSKAAARLSLALQSGLIKREYLALVHGNMKSQQATHWLAKDTHEKKAHIYSQPRQGAKEAKSHFFCVHSWQHPKFGPLSLIRCQLETGRFHQIRAQCAALGHPLLGDQKYTPERAAQFKRPALHSFLLVFPHPKDSVQKFYLDKLPEDMSYCLDAYAQKQLQELYQNCRAAPRH